jgi:hypothetical protein
MLFSVLLSILFCLCVFRLQCFKYLFIYLFLYIEVAVLFEGNTAKDYLITYAKVRAMCVNIKLWCFRLNLLSLKRNNTNRIDSC